MCKKKCGAKEEKVKGGCKKKKGRKCVCCKKLKSKKSLCHIFTSLVLKTIPIYTNPAFLPTGATGCKKQTKKICVKAGGKCRKKCKEGETEMPKGCKKKCKCCVQMSKLLPLMMKLKIMLAREI